MIFAVLVLSIANIGMAWGTKASWTSPNQSSLPTSLDDGKISLAWSKNSSSSQTSVIYGSKGAEVARFFSDGSTLTIGTTSSYKIDSIIITIGSKSSSPAGFKTGGETAGWSAFNTSGKNKYTVATPSAGNSFVITIYKTSGTLTNGRIDITGIDVYYVSAGGATSHSVSAVTSTGTNTYGTVSAAASSVAEGGTTTITAVPVEGYRVTNWAVSGAGASISPSGASNATSTTLTMGTADATVTVTFGAIPSHTITYTNTKSMDNSANPTSYYEGVGVASFTKLRHAVGYDFTGWSPSSISSSATTNQTIDAQWTARAAAAGTGTLTYNFGYSDNTITTSSITRNNGALYDATDLTWTGVTIDDSESAERSGKITTTDAYNSGKYLSLTFKIADGYTFTPTEVQLKAVAVSHDKTIRFEFTDNAGTPNSKYLEQTRGNGSSVGTLTYDFDASDPVTLIGTVTVKIYAYGDDDSWRLGTPLTITGTVAAACTAADHVDISGEWAAFIGYPISLTATAYDDEDNAIETGLSYQWYKDGTADGNMIDGATSATYYKASAVEGDYGSYYCKVSKAGCSDVFSSAFGIKIMRIHLMWENGTEVSDYAFHNFAPIGGSKAVCTIALEGYNYSLQVLDGQYGWGDHNNAWFGRSNYWGTTENPWTHDVVDNKTYLNCDIAGDYVFTLDYSNGYKLGVMYPQPTYYYKGNDDAWSSTHEMTKSCDGTYAYFWTKGATSLQAAGRGTNNNNFLIMNAAGNSTIADGNKLEIRNGEATGFGGTDIWGSSNMGKWDGSSSNASIYNAGDFYIVVFYPNNSINTTNDPKICASTKLPGNATTADEVVYFEKPASNWGDKAYYRIGHRGTSSAPEMELVPGTARLYQHVLSEWTGYEAWSIANNSSWQGSNNSIYTVDTGDEYDITKSTNYFKCETDGNITIILDDANNTADGCTYYNVNTYSGMLTHTATVSDMTNGSVQLNWTDVNDAAQSATSTTSNLAHTCNLQITGVPATGYDVATLTVNGSNFTSGDTHVLSADATIAATFALHNYNVTYSAPGNGNNYTIKVADGSATSTSKTATMGQTITIVASPAAGYDFTGWTITKAGGAGTVTPADASATTTTFTMPTSDVTITASFTLKTYTITAAVNNGDYGSVSPASITVNHGSTISISDNVLTCNGNTLTATATTATAQYTYAFNNWTGVTHGATVTSNLTATANFTRTANSYTLTWNLAGGTVTTAGTGADVAATGTPSSSVAFGAAITAPVVTKSGYTFAGWDVSPAATMPAATTTYTATWTPVAATHTVTYNAQGGSVTPSSETVSTATLPTPTKSGYTFQGWYTSGGAHISGTYNPEADITLYAQWQSSDCDAGGATTLADINFKDATWSGKTFSQGNTDTEDLIKGVYFWCKDATKHFSLEDNTSKGLTFPADNMSSNNRYFCIPITGINSSNKQITVTLKHGYSSSTASFKYYYNDGRTEWVDASAGSGTSVSDAQKSDTEITFTLNNSGKGLTNTAGHLFIGRNSSSFTNIYGVTVTTPGAAGTCYYVTYNGNGATGGYTTDEAAYASGDNATAATNSFTKTGYTFKEWRTNANGTGTKYEAGDPIAISGNITLYAIWQAAGYTLAWNTNGGSALAGDYSSGSFADGADITAPDDPTRANYTFDSWNTAADGSGNAYTGTMPAANTTYYAVWKNTLTLKTGSQGSESDKAPKVFLGGSSLNGFSAHKAAGYTLQGYYTAATGGTKVLNADGSFAASNIARFVTSGKWSRTTGDTILVAQWESSYLLKWNLQLNKAEDAISTTSKESATARVTTASMTNLTNNGWLTITGSKKSDLTSQIETPINLSGAESKYMSVSFDVTAGYQLLPSAVKVMVQPVGNGENKYAKLILEDENSHSINTVVECEGTEKGKKTTVTLSNAGGTVFTGTVTLKILVYNASGASTTNNCYRLGSPIQIDGAIEAACDLPSYEGLEYDQTEYTVGGDEASAIRVTGGSADTYQWKWNSTNDRSTGTSVGTSNASYTPLTTISEVGTRYYWCELTNDDCDGVVKTPAVAITVRANKSEASVTWTDPANEPNYGGGGYVIRATMNSGYDGELSAEDLTAPAGIRITNVSIDNEADQKYIEATFDVTTAFNRDENSKISFTLSHDATTGYDAISDEHDVDYDACSGGEEGSAAIALTSAIHDEGSGNAPRYWFETSGVGRVFGINYGKATLGTSSDAAFSTEGYSYVASSTSQRWVFQPYVEGVNKIRIYIKSATNTLRVLSIGKNASWQDQSGKYSNIAVDTIIYSNDKTTGLDNNQKGYAEIQFSSALTKNNYYMITMSSSSTYIYGVTLYSGSVGDGGNLATSLTFANTGPIAADASTANFQNIASKSGENRNTLGTITYSSNNDAATVNATTGEVSIHAKGTAQAVTITATLSASGCYQGATATYTINVAADVCDEPSGSIELTSGSATKCSGESVILTMTGFTSGATVEWYNGDTKVNGTSGYTIVTSGSTSTLTTSNAGTYSAIAKVDGGCASGAGRTNSITISDISVDASATKIVDKWYVKNGRLTPDIALWQLGEGATLDEVTIERNVSGEGTLGLTSSDFVARDGIVYLSGKEPSANETGADIEYTLTLTVKDACDDPHEMTEKTITLTHQKNTDKHVLAFVVNGTAKGGFTEGITAPQTTGVSLYNTIAAQFDVQATNIYATDDEKKLKEYYSQYDILCITDYPNTQTKGANSKSYVDAIGSLIDIRPILTMEAFVSKLENWKVKGISGNPKSPTTRQYTMDLQCKDHEIFAGTELTTIGEGDETMYRVSMVDSTKEDYATLDATYGATLPHKEKESKKGAGDGEYNYGGKPALQGFTFTAEMANDLLPIGLIDDGAGNPLQVGIERQRNMEARLMVLGINSYAMERLDKDGETVVINALKYLMKKNAEDIADCSTSFVGGADGDETNWNNADNWTGNTVPDKTQKVRILAPCVVPAGVKAHVAGVLIAPNGKYNREANSAEGSLTIAAGGALVVDGKIQAVTAPAYNRPRATSSGDLAVLTDADAQGALIFDNSEGETQATVQMYSPSYWEIMEGTNKKKSYWSYVAIPIQDAYVGEFFYGAVTYLYDETEGWIRKRIGTHLHAFEGIGLSLPEGHTETFYGPLAPTEDRTVTLTKTTSGGNGENLIGNSWTAPIQIANFEASDFGSASQNVMIYCTGRDGTQDDVRENAEYVTATEENDGTVSAGQWVSIPINVPSLDGYDGLKVIPAMQAFQVTTGTETSLTLNYDKLVRDVNIVSDNLTEKQHAPARRSAGAKKSLMSTMRVRVSGVKTRTDVWLLEDDRFSDEFDNGWEAKYAECDDRSAQLYAQSETGNMSFLAKPDIDGTVLGFAPSKDGNQYLFTFHYVGDDEYYLNDLKLTTATLISNENNYLFTYEEGDTNRFYISRQPLGAPAVATGVDNPREEAKPRKFIYKDKMYILYNGRVFDATGKVVK